MESNLTDHLGKMRLPAIVSFRSTVTVYLKTLCRSPTLVCRFQASKAIDTHMDGSYPLVFGRTWQSWRSLVEPGAFSFGAVGNMPPLGNHNLQVCSEPQEIWLTLLKRHKMFNPVLLSVGRCFVFWNYIGLHSQGSRRHPLNKDSLVLDLL